MLKSIDILVVTETKLNSTFLESLFLMNGFFKLFRLNRNNNGNGIMIFIRNTVSSKILEKHIFLNDIKIIVKNANHNLRVICIFLNNVNQALDTYSKYDKDFLVGEFNREI